MRRKFPLWSIAFGLAMGGAGSTGYGGQADPPAKEEKVVAQDLYGDPLPEGAIARLGTVRFRGGGFKPCFLPDGKTILTASRNSLQFWETSTGRLLRKIPMGSLDVHRIALSPDGKLTAAVGDGLIRIWDIATSEEVRTLASTARSSNQGPAVFTPDGKLVVSVANGLARFEEIASGREVTRNTFDTKSSDCAISPDGETLALAGADRGRLYLWNWKTHEKPREVNFVGDRIQHLSFSPTSRLLACCGQLGSSIYLLNVDTGKLTRTLDAGDKKITAIDLAFSPDGKKLAVADSGNRKNFSGGLCIWDLERGDAFRELLTYGEQVLFIGFAPDSRTVAATTGVGVHVWDMETGREMVEVQAAHHGHIGELAVTTHGQVITASDDNTVRVWDLRSGKQKLKLDHGQWVRAIALSPEGTTLASSTSHDHTICLWDLQSGNELKRLGGQQPIASGRAIAFTADGQQVVSWADNRSLRIWDLKTDKAIERSVPPEVALDLESDRVRAADRVMLLTQLGATRFSPDGKWLIFAFHDHFKIHEVATDKSWADIPHGAGRIDSLAFAQDSRSFVTSASGATSCTVSLWEMASGKMRRSNSIHGEPVPRGRISFSSDSKLVALGLNGPANSEIRVLNVVSGQNMVKFTGLPSQVTALGFSPDNKHLVSGMADTTVLVWKLALPVVQASKELEPDAVRRLWDDLASTDAETAYNAICALVESPKKTVPFIQANVPAVALRAAKVAQLIAALSSESFSARNQATRELDKLGELAEADLKTALAQSQPLELRRRIEGLLNKLPAGPITSPEILREVRAVEVLETIGTSEAKKLLESLAAGVPESRKTGEAKASVQRLTQRAAKAP